METYLGLDLNTWWFLVLGGILTGYAVLFIVPLSAMLSVANIPRLITKRRYFTAFIFSGITIAFLIVLFSIGLFPNIVISTIAPDYNLTIYNASSTALTLKNLLIVTLIGIPLVAVYTISIFWIFKGKVKTEDLIY